MSLLKGLRLIKVRRILKKYQQMKVGPFLRVFTILFFWILCAHWMACGFFIIGWGTCPWYAHPSLTMTADGRQLDCSVRGSPCEGNWITVYWPIMRTTCAARQLPEQGARVSGLTLGTMHVRSLAWALSTMSSMGYGKSPVAISNTDYLYGYATQIIGACLSAAIFSNFAQLINKADAGAARYLDQLQQIHEFSRLYKLSKPACKTLLDYHELLFSAYHGFDLQQVADMFPKHLQVSVFYKLHKDQIRELPVFRDVDTSFLQEIVLKLGTQVLLQDDFAFRKDDLGELMYFIQFGSIEIGNEDMSIVYVTKAKGSYFGEIAVFSNQRRTASARAKSDVIMYTLSKSAFEAVAARFPENYARVYERASQMLMKVKSQNVIIERRTVKETNNEGETVSTHDTPSASGAPPTDGAPGAAPSIVKRLTRGVKRISREIENLDPFKPAFTMGQGPSPSMQDHSPQNPLHLGPSTRGAGGPADDVDLGPGDAMNPLIDAPADPSDPLSGARDYTRASVLQAALGPTVLEDVHESEEEPEDGDSSRQCTPEGGCRGGGTSAPSLPPSPTPSPPETEEGQGPPSRSSRMSMASSMGMQASGRRGWDGSSSTQRLPPMQTKRLPIFHTTELASLPPLALSSLYSGQTMMSLRLELLPMLQEVRQQVKLIHERLDREGGAASKQEAER
jgi:CRP-like cAMP-binding protein